MSEVHTVSYALSQLVKVQEKLISTLTLQLGEQTDRANLAEERLQHYRERSKKRTETDEPVEIPPKKIPKETQVQEKKPRKQRACRNCGDLIHAFSCPKIQCKKLAAERKQIKINST